MNQNTALSAFVLAVLVSATLVGFVGTVGAQNESNTTINETAPYYENSSSNVSVASWLEGRTDPTLDNITAIATRVGPFVIGGGTANSVGGAEAGALVTGLMVTAVFLGAVMGSGVGSVGGAAIATAIAAGIVEVGLAPQWMWAVIVLGVGVVLATVSIRAFR